MNRGLFASFIQSDTKTKEVNRLLSSTLMAKLSEEQQTAAKHLDGPAMVVAAAGSGKTTLIIARVAYLLDQGIAPSEILLCTFTKKASIEMKARLHKAVGNVTKMITVATMHSVAYQMKADIREDKDKELLVSPDFFIERAMREVNVKSNKDDMVAQLGKAKSLGLVPNQVTDGVLRQVYEAYEAIKQKEKLVDFEDLILHAADALQRNPDFIKKWRAKYHYVMVDEFQDTNPTQWSWITHLVQNHKNLFVVGDDWQSIYAFRGAQPALMRSFTATYSTAKVYFLTMNYRSHGAIIGASNWLIQLNRGHQVDKVVQAYEPISEYSDVAFWFNKNADWLTDEEQEAQALVKMIEQGRAERPHLPLKEYAVLYRTNRQAILYQSVLEENNIPCHVVGDRSFFEYPPVDTLLRYLKTSLSHEDPQVWAPILNRPYRHLTKEEVSTLAANGWQAVQQEAKLWSLRLLLNQIAQAPSTEHALLITVQQAFPDWANTEKRESVRWLDVLMNMAKKISKPVDFLRYVDRLRDKEQENKQKQDAVQLMTIHQSKGLEFDTVFLVGAVQDVLPHKNAEGEEEKREETRLMYVAMTRAKERLCVTAPSTYLGQPSMPSSYIEHMEKLLHPHNN